MTAEALAEQTLTKWWKCDLQVATPAWDFTLPAESSFDFTREEDQAAFAAVYMEAVRAAGVEVIALADHNTGEWIDVMVRAGQAAGVTVFPGCEITTGSGSDGAHLVIVGDPSKTSQDFDRLLVAPIGYDDANHPRYHYPDGRKVPGSAGNTISQILDELPDGYLVIGPHVLNDNGLASGRTAKGDIRYKALHHPKLAAIDPGDCSVLDGDSWNQSFRSRTLTNFPRIKTLAFIATSDAYKLDDIGRRFCWIRMEKPTLEALRQAFLDHEARILCDWDPRLETFPDRNPNNVRHAWVSELIVENALRGTTPKLAVRFHHGLNVLIGGRGSGKSTVVAALRQLYAGYETLPPSIRSEAEQFAAAAFGEATLTATHAVAASQEPQTVRWSAADSLDSKGRSDVDTPTAFRVRVVNQKELFARVATDVRDPLVPSRSLLSFIDEGLELLGGDKSRPGTWSRNRSDAATRWVEAARAHHRLVTDLAQRAAVQAEIETLRNLCTRHHAALWRRYRGKLWCLARTRGVRPPPDRDSPAPHGAR